MKLINQHRTGLFREHGGVRAATHERVRLTIPAREALENAGATIVPMPSDTGAPPIFAVTLGAKVPPDLIATRIIGTSDLGLRLEHEPAYPGEIGEAYWEQVDFTPCPACGAPLVWYEAGYAPGYRVCARAPHHHFQAR